MFLRQSTAQTIRLGPFLDATDGVTEEVALTITPALRRLSKDGGAFAAASGAVNATHDSDGWYSVSLTTTDTNTVGELILNVQTPATHLPVWIRWWVLEEAVYDAMYGASAGGPLQPTVAGRTLDVTATGAAGIDWGNVENPTTALDLSGTDIQLVDTTTTNTDMRGTDSALLASSAPTNFGDMSISVTTGLVDITQAAADKVWSTTARVLTAGTNIALAKGVGVTGFNDIAATDVVSAGAITTLSGAIVNVDLVDTTTTNTDMRGTDSAFLASSAPTNFGALAITAGGVADADTVALAGVTASATKLERGAKALVTGAAVGTPTTTVIDTDLTEATTDHYKTRIVTFTTGAIAGQSSDITAYNGTSKELTVTALTDAPSAGDQFVIS